MGQPRAEVFEGRDGQHYWRVRNKRGQIIAVGGEGHKKKTAAKSELRQLKNVLEHMSPLKIEEVDEFETTP